MILTNLSRDRGLCRTCIVPSARREGEKVMPTPYPDMNYHSSGYLPTCDVFPAISYIQCTRLILYVALDIVCIRDTIAQCS